MQKSPVIDPVVNKAMVTIRAVRNKTRQRIIDFISSNDNKQTVTEIHTRLCLDQAVVSQHLLILRQARIVTAKRDGKNIYYSLDYNRIDQIHSHCQNLQP